MAASEHSKARGKPKKAGALLIERAALTVALLAGNHAIAAPPVLDPCGVPAFALTCVANAQTAGGIQYANPAGLREITLGLSSPMVISPDAGYNGLTWLQNAGSTPMTLVATPGALTVTSSGTGPYASAGLFVGNALPMNVDLGSAVLNITSMGDYRSGVLVRAMGSTTTPVSQSSNIVLGTGTISTNGVAAAGVLVETGRSLASGAPFQVADAAAIQDVFRIESRSAITTTGALAEGVKVMSNGLYSYDVNLAVHGSVTTTGEASPAVSFSGAGAWVSPEGVPLANQVGRTARIETSSNLTTSGRNSSGVLVRTESFKSLDVVQSSGHIQIDGAASGAFAGLSVLSTNWQQLAPDAGAGRVAITQQASASIATTDGAMGIFASMYGGAEVSVSTSGDISTAGNGSGGAISHGVSVSAATVGQWNGSGAYVGASSPSVSITQAAGSITTSGLGAAGIQATAGSGYIFLPMLTSAAKITVVQEAAASIQTTGAGARGIAAILSGGESVRITTAGTISTEGEAQSLSGAMLPATGVYVSTAPANQLGSSGAIIGSQAPIATVLQRGGIVSTSGQMAAGIELSFNENQSGAFFVASTGGGVGIASSGAPSGQLGWISPLQRVEQSAGAVITTSGATAAGIKLRAGMSEQGCTVSVSGFSGAALLSFVADPSVPELATNPTAVCDGVNRSSAHNTPLEVSTAGVITTTGRAAHGVDVRSYGYGRISVDQGAGGMINASGKDAHGILVASMSAMPSPSASWRGGEAVPPSNGPVSVNIAGTVQGGWGLGAGIKIAEVREPSQTVSINLAAGAQLGALSDRALVLENIHTIAPVTLTNAGQITGYATFAPVRGDSAFVFNNSGTLALRDFSVSYNNGPRDRVATPRFDFGAGGSAASVFNNLEGGTLSIAPIPNSSSAQTAEVINLPRFVNSGTISLQNLANGGSAAVAGDTLRITGTNGGGEFVANGGTLKIDTVLGDSQSVTDKLVVDRVVLGSAPTGVQVRNAGGLGALTTGNGIRVIEVAQAGASAAGAFVLKAPMQAGAYEYNLFQGGAQAADGNWYLRSQALLAVPPPDSGSTDSATKSAAPLYRVAVPGYVVGKSAVQEMGFGVIARLHERTNEPQGTAHRAKAHEKSAWGRVVGERFTVNGDVAFGADVRTRFLQVGRDLSVSYGEKKERREFGIMGTYGTASASFTDRTRVLNGNSPATGSNSTEMLALGAYYVRHSEEGAYMDLVGNLLMARSRYSDVLGASGEQKGSGLALSMEGGKPYRINNHWHVEPQGQLSYQSMRYGAFQDQVSSVSATTAESLRGRAGVRLTWAKNTVRPVDDHQFFVSVNLVHDLIGARLSSGIAGTTVNEQLGRTYFDLGAGAQFAFGKARYVYINGKVERGAGGSDQRRGYMLGAGLKFEW